MKTVLILISLLFPVLGWAQNVSLSKAAELACHRIERLTSLPASSPNSIDKGYLNNFAQLKIRMAEPKDIDASFCPQGTVFVTHAFQVPGVDSTANALDLCMGGDGKTLKHFVRPGSVATSAPAWPLRDPVTLTEDALHYVLEEWTKDPNMTQDKIAPFQNSLSSVHIEQISAGNAVEALVTIEAKFLDLGNNEVTQIMQLRLSQDGVVLGVSIAP